MPLSFPFLALVLCSWNFQHESFKHLRTAACFLFLNLFSQSNIFAWAHTPEYLKCFPSTPAAIHPRSLPRLTLPMRPTVLSQRARAASPALPCQFSPAHLLTAPVCLLFRSRHAVISVSHPTRQQNLALPPDVSGICLLPTLPAGATRSPPACTGFLKGFA